MVIQGLELVKLGGERGSDKQEVDFLVVNFTHQYILNIEVKKWLGQIQGKPENIIEKAKEQLESIKAIIEDWFGGDLKGVILSGYGRNLEKMLSLLPILI